MASSLSLLLLSFLLSIGLAKVTNISTSDELTVWLYASNIVRITTLPPKNQIIATPTATSRIVTYEPNASIPYTTSHPNDNSILIKTADLQINCNKQTNLCSFYDINDTNMHNPILTETNKTFTPFIDKATNNQTFQILQEWKKSEDTQALFGWGEYQNGFTNYIGSTIRCEPFNTEACIPMFITNAFYGIYWDNEGVSTLNSINSEIIINGTQIRKNKLPSLAAPIYADEKAQTQTQADCVWYNVTFPFTASSIDGDRSFFSFFNDWTHFGAAHSGSVYLEFWIQRKNETEMKMVDMFNYTNNIPASLAMQPFYMDAGESISVFINYQCLDAMPRIFYREPSNFIDIESNTAFFIDYYFIFSPPQTYKSPVNTASLDGVIKGYRLLTEAAPLYELTCYGFWQCKQRYSTQQEVIDDATEYRQRQLPIDAIVQDWHYWGPNEDWGPQWDLTNYPDPQGLVKELHGMNFYFMVSVWSEFGQNATCLQYLKTQEKATGNTEIIPGTINQSMPWFDPYNKQAQIDYYQCIKATMFDIGVDAIWSDATEPAQYPDLNQLYDNGKYSGNALFDAYSLQVIQALQKGLNRDQPHKRPFDLTRSTFAGQAKTGGAVWSGDTTASYDTLRRQITASLSTQAAGNPYWSQDIGGFFRPSCNYDCWWYKQLLIRWFQFGAFAPIFRVHGNNVNTAFWNYGPIVLADVALIDNLRYRLLPYIYSLAYYVTEYGYTLQRALIFDFYDDENAYNASTQFMFGPCLLVSPVFEYDNSTNIYLPNKYAKWYDFWTGQSVEGGVYLEDVIVALEEIPIHVHEGSILILAPFMQYANEKYPWNELEVRLYGGEDAQFIYFNDDGKDRLSLDNGQYFTILFEWNDAKKTLTIGEREGSYDGMISSIMLNIVVVSEGHGIGVNVTSNPDKSVVYTGDAMTVSL